MRIACLHTAESNIEVFEAALRSLRRDDVTLRHLVRADLLATAELQHGVTAEIIASTQAALLALCRDADAVLLNCSTLGVAVSGDFAGAGIPVVRVDRALAEAAVQRGGKVIVLCTAETTIGPTTRLFSEMAFKSGAEVDVRLVPGAWAMFRAGDQLGYLAAIAEAAERAYADGGSVIALAQASMAPAAPLVKSGARPLSSPATGLSAAIAAADRAFGASAVRRP